MNWVNIAIKIGVAVFVMFILYRAYSQFKIRKFEDEGFKNG